MADQFHLPPPWGGKVSTGSSRYGRNQAASSPGTLRFRWGIVLVMVWWSLSNSHALNPTFNFADTFRSLWSTQRGMPDNVPRCLLQVDSGYLWVGTERGAARFDGYDFTSFKPANIPEMATAIVNRMVQDTRGGIWFGTENAGVVFHDGRISKQWGKAEGLSTLHVKEMVFDAAGTLFVATGDARLHELRGKTFVERGLFRDDTPSPSQQITALWADPSQGVWAGTAGRGLFRLNSGVDGIVSTPFELPHPDVRCLAGSASHGLWVATEDFSLTHVRDGKILSTQRFSGLLEERPWSAYLASSGVLWIGTSRGRVLPFADGIPCRQFESKEFFGDTVLSIMEDRQGTLWAGVQRNGLRRLVENPLRVYESKPGQASPNIRSMIELSDGTLILGQELGGLSRFIGDEMVPYHVPGIGAYSTVLSLESRPRGGFLAGVLGKGLFQIDGNQSTVLGPDSHAGLADIRAILVNPDGSTWIGTRHSGLLLLEGERLTEMGPAQGLSAKEVRFLYRSKQGWLYVGTHDSGLLVQRDSKLPFESIPHRSGSSNLKVRWISEDSSGCVWVGTLGQGFGLVDKGVVHTLTQENGGPDNIVNQVHHDASGWIWLATEFHVYRADARKAKAACMDPSHKPGFIDVGDEFATVIPRPNGGSRQAGLNTSDGRIVLGTKLGLVVLQPAPLPGEGPGSSIIIEEMMLDGKPVFIEPGTALGPGRGAISFEFTSLGLRDSRHTEFQHWLTGVDDTWKDSTKSRTAHYTYLPPGRYTFRVRARAWGSDWSEPTSLSFVMRPHFYETRSFYAVCTIAVIALGVALHHSRLTRQRETIELTQLRQFERLRWRIARDLHDDSGANVSRILAQVEQSEIQPSPSAWRALAKSAKELRRSMNEIIWATSPGHDTLESFVAHVTSLAEELCNTGEIKLRIEPPAVVPSTVLSASTRHHCYLAAKEALTNALKHAQCREVELRMSIAESLLEIRIRDDGKGFLPTQSTHRNGLRNMQSRLTELGGECLVDSVPGQGTTVTFRVPLPQNPPLTRQGSEN